MTPLLVSRCRTQDEPAARAVQEWIRPGGGVAARFFREPAGYLLRFPGVADFEVDAEGRAATCFPAPGTADDAYWRVYNHQVTPLMLSLGGALVLHASAVEVCGRAMGFVGGSGAGKSTLAASFVGAGQRFLADDALLVEARDEPPVAHPVPAALRLYPDSLDALARMDGAGRLARGEAHQRDTPCVLGHLFILDGESADPQVESVSGAEAFIALVRHAFHVDPADRQRGALHFAALAALARSARVARLRYPRRYEALAAVRELVTLEVAFAGARA